MTLSTVTYGTDGKPTAGFTAGVTDTPVEGPQIGALTETAPASDTASSGLNGRLQRIAQRLTSLIALFAFGPGAAAGGLRTVLAANSGVDIGDVDVISMPSIPAGNNVIGKVGGITAKPTFTLTVDATAVASGEVVAATQALAGVFRVNDGTALLSDLVLVDEADLKQPLRIVFMDANVSMGTVNNAPAITDGDAANILGYIDIATADYVDLGGVSIAHIKQQPVLLKAVSGATSVYVAAVNVGAGAVTYGSATALKLRLGLQQD